MVTEARDPGRIVPRFAAGSRSATALGGVWLPSSRRAVGLRRVDATAQRPARGGMCHGSQASGWTVHVQSVSAGVSADG